METSKLGISVKERRRIVAVLKWINNIHLVIFLHLRYNKDNFQMNNIIEVKIMNIRKCENGHFYNGDRYKICPYCEEAKLLQNPDTEKQENAKKEKTDKKKEPKVRPVKKKYVEKDIRQDYRNLTEQLIERNISITTMESATAGDRKSTRLNSSHPTTSRMPSSA